MSIPPAIQAFLKGPSCPAPEGQTSNLEHHSDSNTGAFFVVALCILLVTAATLARAYSRVFVVKQLHLEDYLGIGAIVPFAGVVWCFIDFGLKAGFFVQQWDLPGSVLIDLGKNVFVISTVYSLVMLLLKTAILLEWIRIFVPHRTRNVFYWCSIILILINTGTYTSAILSGFGGCRPLEKLWHFWLPGSCIDRKARDTVNAVFNLVIDVFILVLPQKIIWKLQMTVRRKIGVSVVFSVGLLVVAIAAGRLYATVTLDYPDDITKPLNTSYKFSQTLLWAMAEITCIFLVFCVPALPKLFTEHGLVSRIMISWRSWTRLPHQSSSKRSNKASWPRNVESTPESQRRIGNPNEVDMQDYPGTELPMARQQSAGIPIRGNFYNPPGAKIFKTVEIDSRDDAASEISGDPRIKSQHPWMAENV